MGSRFLFGGTFEGDDVGFSHFVDRCSNWLPADAVECDIKFSQ